ncbi:hypothetical protein [Parapedobacter soli]|uniref:hypothetical protein n=1 Tax=Parapedobacter soli TaxID=416955 RepID=UPI0021C8422F|nr:hypothetical protein [Parapedobacter soli]
MKINEKYPKLKDKAFLSKLLTKNVYGSMALEGQTVPKARVRQIVASVLEEYESQEGKLVINQQP